MKDMSQNLSLFGILEPESEKVEYKSSWHHDCLKTLAAFANTQGGVMRIGIEDATRRVLGWTGRGEEQERITGSIVENLGIHPFRIEVETYDGKPVLTIHMTRSVSPISLRGRYYRRIGNTTRDIPPEELMRFLLLKTGQSWDELACDAPLEAISAEAFAEFRLLARERLPDISVSDSTEIILNKLQMRTQDGNLKRGGILLFGKEPQQYFRSSEVQIGRFGDATTILDEHVVRGNLFAVLGQTLEALRKYILVRYEIPTAPAGRSLLQDLQRREVWEFPYDAVREALLNALIHRDYGRQGAITVRVFDDRLVIANPGGLPEGITVHDLEQDTHESLRRNPLLAQVMYYAKLVERWGTGTIRMRNACRTQSAPDPEFESSPSHFMVTLRKGNPAYARNAMEQAVLALIASQGSISRHQVMELLGDERVATNLLLRLRRNGQIIQSGSRRWTRYSLPPE